MFDEQDKKAFADACEDWSKKSAGKDLGEYFWNAAREHYMQKGMRIDDDITSGSMFEWKNGQPVNRKGVVK